MSDPNEPNDQSTTAWAQQAIAGSFATASEAADRLRLAAQHCHLVGGASICPLVEGHEIVITVVPINRDQAYPANPVAKKLDKGEKVDNAAEARWGVGKADLMTLSAAAGIEWTYSKRQDDGRSPHYVHWKVKGRYRQVDGTWRPIEGDRDVDVRQDSAQLNEKSERAIAQLRETVMRSAITKAKLRAIREALGIAHSFTDDELQRPFVFARTVFTGRSNDPRTRMLFAHVIAQQQLAATAALYGMGTPMLAMPAAPAPAGLLPAAGNPDIDEPPDLDDDDDDAPPAPPPPPPPPRPRAAPPAGQGQAGPGAGGAQGNGGGANGGTSAAGATGGDGEVFVIPGGKTKGTPIEEAPDKDLEYWGTRIEKELASGDVEPRWRPRNENLLAAIREELALRKKSDAAGENY